MIRVEKLTRIYEDFTAVDQVSFDIGPGEIVGLLGHNGAGKTTIMKMLTGFLEPTEGKVEINGLDIENNLERSQKLIGYLPESCPVYPEMTVFDYLEYAAALNGVAENDRFARVLDAMEKTELKKKANQIVSTLSRGYRQRVGVAQTLLHRPEILILDEPTNGLDPTQIQHMRILIKNLATNAIVIISTHILQEVQAVCDRVIIICDGQKALDAKLDELQESSRLVLVTDMPHDNAQTWLSGFDGVSAFELGKSEKNKYTYFLTLESSGDRDEIASLLAEALLGRKQKLYALHHEVRDLETVFGEISSRKGGIVQ